MRNPEDLRITVRGGHVVAMAIDLAAGSPTSLGPSATAATQ
ncbi:hypothetical protein I553_7315 [Mycobacterium xenopi 4042]|uniref:Uncharacterized protein n=1 Tax=Mycobacterium xenopi 4042 TaxID=1299334 RepID=X8E7V7_MYCXE|nr:hypothetical protein I553_7315 [Mycobacterium xenopi 4042]